MQSTFNFTQFSDRDNLIAQLICCIALNEKDHPLVEQALAGLNLQKSDLKSLDQSFENFEQSLNDNDESLSDLLESTVKNACCS